MVGLRFEEELLKGTIEPANGLLFIDSFVTLKALHESLTGCCDCLRCGSVSRPGMTKFSTSSGKESDYNLRIGWTLS